MTQEELLLALRRLPGMRVQVENLDNALSTLTPEERLIANHLLLYPKRNNIRLVCEMLHLEPTAIYNRRRQILKKLSTAITGSAPYCSKRNI